MYRFSCMFWRRDTRHIMYIYTQYVRWIFFRLGIYVCIYNIYKIIHICMYPRYKHIMCMYSVYIPRENKHFSFLHSTITIYIAKQLVLVCIKSIIYVWLHKNIKSFINVHIPYWKIIKYFKTNISKNSDHLSNSAII